MKIGRYIHLLLSDSQTLNKNQTTVSHRSELMNRYASIWETKYLMGK